MRPVALLLFSVFALVGCNPFDPYGCDARGPLEEDQASLADATVGQTYADDIPGGWAVVTEKSGDLPPGLELSGDGARIEGTPTTAGTYNFTLSVTEFSTQCTGRTGDLVIDLEVLAGP